MPEDPETERYEFKSRLCLSDDSLDPGHSLTGPWLIFLSDGIMYTSKIPIVVNGLNNCTMSVHGLFLVSYSFF